MSVKLGYLAEVTGCKLHGDASCQIDRVATLPHAQPGSITFLTNRRYKQHLKHTKASAVILAKDDLDDCSVNALISSNPYLAYARIAALLYPQSPWDPGIHSTTSVSDDTDISDAAKIGPHCSIGPGVSIATGVVIGPGCVVESEVSIGEHSHLHANVVLCHGVYIGSRALIHPGVVIGSDGFGLVQDNGAWVKVPQVGSVVIGDDVEVGANTTIDRGAIEDTVIGNGVKLDNQIQIGHNVIIGDHTAMAGCSGVAGSAHIGSRCTIGGAAGVLGHLEIADDVHITAYSLVTQSIKEPGVYSSGTPLQANAKWRRNYVHFSRLDEYARRLKAVESELGKKKPG